MSAIRTKLGEGGRVIIPATFRQNLHLAAGDDLILHMQEEMIYITTPDQALHKLQAKVKNYVDTTGEHISLVDELIAMRRLEVDLCIILYLMLQHYLLSFNKNKEQK